MAKDRRAQSGQRSAFSIAGFVVGLTGIAAWITAAASCSNAYTNYQNYLAQLKNGEALSERIRTIEVELNSAKEATAQAQADAVKSAQDLKRSLDRFVVFYRNAIDTANQALQKLDQVEAQQGRLSISDYKPMHDNALQNWKYSLGVFVTVVQNGRQLSKAFEDLLDHDVDSIRNGLEPLDEKTLRELFIKIRDSVDSKVETLNQSLNKVAQME